MNQQPITFKEFSLYAGFLLGQPELFRKLQLFCFQSISAAGIPALTGIQGSDQEQKLEALVSRCVENFLRQALENKTGENSLMAFESWKLDDSLPFSIQLAPQDVLRIWTLMKVAYLENLPEYTADLAQYSAVVRELELYQALLQEQLLKFFDKDRKILKQEKNLMDSVINNAVEGIFAFDLDLKIIRWNNVLARWNNVEAKEMIGRDLFNLFPKSCLQEDMESMSKVLRGDHLFIPERPFVRREGYYEAHVFPIYDEKQSITGGLGIIHDTTHRHQAEDTIRQAHDFYLQILEDMPALIWRSGIDGQCDYFNKAWLAYTGSSMDESIGEGWLRGVHPDDQKYCLETYSTAFNARESFEMEYRLQRHDGVYHQIVDYGKPVYGPQGAFIGYIGTCFDIQVRINDQELIYNQNKELAEALLKLSAAEEKLKETNEALEIRVQERTNELEVRENFLNSIVEQSPFSTWISDKNGTMIQLNPACLELFGIQDSASVLGRYNILQDKIISTQPYYKDIQAVFTAGKEASFELENYKLADAGFPGLDSKEELCLIVSIFPIKNKKGEITNAVIKHEDIREQKTAERALKQSEEQLRMITDSLPVWISYADSEKRYRFVNKAYEDLFKKSKSDIIGQRMIDVIGPEAYENIREAIERVLAGEGPQHLESSQNYGEAGIRYLRISIIPHSRNANDGFYLLGYDISERHKTEQELERLYAEASKRNKELKRINTDLDNFTYTASHDLKAPVANMEGLLNLILKRQEKDLAIDPRLFGMMNTSVSKLKRTIDDLVEITKIQKQVDQQLSEKISFPEVTEDIFTDLQSLIDESGAIIKEEFEVMEILYAKSHLRSILYNLVSNALKYRSPDRQAKILIKTMEQEEGLILEVQDNGLGMSEGQQKKLFTMFQRMHSHIEGTGIGLYTIKRIIENNGGRINVQSEAGKGTSFRVVLIGEPQGESLIAQTS